MAQLTVAQGEATRHKAEVERVNKKLFDGAMSDEKYQVRYPGRSGQAVWHTAHKSKMHQKLEHKERREVHF